MWDIVVKKLETADRSIPLVVNIIYMVMMVILIIMIIIWIYDDLDDDGNDDNDHAPAHQYMDKSVFHNNW